MWRATFKGILSSLGNRAKQRQFGPVGLHRPVSDSATNFRSVQPLAVPIASRRLVWLRAATLSLLIKGATKTQLIPVTAFICAATMNSDKFSDRTFMLTRQPAMTKIT